MGKIAHVTTGPHCIHILNIQAAHEAITGCQWNSSPGMQQYEQGQNRTLADLMALLSAGIVLLDWLERWWGWTNIYLWTENNHAGEIPSIYFLHYCQYVMYSGHENFTTTRTSYVKGVGNSKVEHKLYFKLIKVIHITHSQMRHEAFIDIYWDNRPCFTRNPL